MRSQALPGFRDFYPAETALRNHIFDTWRTVASRYGFEEYDGPPLEPLKLYTDKSGPEIVEQLYNFTDKGGREITLRPEMTPTVARMVAARAQSLKKPIRWFSIPQLFRYERQQRGRLREHFQLNVDIIGEASFLADAEVIAVAVDILRELGLSSDDFVVRLSDRNVMRALLTASGVPEELLAQAYAACDKIEREDSDALSQKMAAAGIAPGTGERVLEIARIRGKEALAEEMDRAGVPPETAASLLGCADALGSMGLGEFVKIDLAVVRGLAYYTGVVYELFDVGGSLRAICGGGRYDNLLSDIGGVDLPAQGFGMGDVVLGELLKDRGLAPDTLADPLIFAVAVGGDDVETVLGLAHQLRQGGFRLEYSLREQNVGKQLKLAAARRAAAAIVIGPEERAAEAAVVKDLVHGSEAKVARADLASHLARLLARV